MKFRIGDPLKGFSYTYEDQALLDELKAHWREASPVWWERIEYGEDLDPAKLARILPCYAQDTAKTGDTEEQG